MGRKSKIPEYTLYRNCHELPMDRFICVLCDKDLSQLTKSGQAPVFILEAHFQDLYNEFVDLRGDKNGTAALELLKQITYNQNKKLIVQECLEIMRIRYVRDIAVELRQMGYNYRFDFSQKEEYERDLTRVAVSLKRIDTLIKSLEKDLNKFKSDESDGGGFKRSDFDHMNSSLSKYMGFHVKESEVSVARWCAMMRDMDRHIEVMNAQHNNLLTEKAHG